MHYCPACDRPVPLRHQRLMSGTTAAIIFVAGLFTAGLAWLLFLIPAGRFVVDGGGPPRCPICTARTHPLRT